jgi:hypothetical protein
MKQDKILTIIFLGAALLICFSLYGGGVHLSQVLADDATTTATVSNATPTVGAFNINGGDASITLTEGDISSVKATTTATVTDDNGCTDLSNVQVLFYRTDKTDGCSPNEYDCYSTSSCSVVESGNTCDGDSDTSADYECSVTLNYYTDPTDGSASASSTNWTMKVTATDDDGVSGNNTDTIEVDSLAAIDVTTPIAYGSVALDSSSADKEQTVTNTGNVRLDLQFSGTAMSCDTGSIDAAQQKYSTTTISAWADAPYTLATSSAEKDWDLAKSTGSTSTAAAHWMLHTPASGVEGSCSGSNTLTAVNDDQTQD